ncbi:uncharacterized protein AMSG_08781 [Thecamonas trahens ATCC 50062]|uniref:Uncharacterized protein n=1 Tax=Thecamonas trahens ATCC 50062 TaxID=461836 RepID=A0A0L0DLU4_THETB|nr:hypothetical protein, variant [Thecamonas trahens ATCC 50062]XP_013754552.1 hypothetical protein AMSG_08781 [Thecamonas trahens ATCC 50062]KNC53289.1 hypothetical protein, variant [Thecamonas trahens ATCC 50062]KNC53290.1 hypothetical protein AMSG_08781 [Thecamonas trahens ATCC 50062]|eukprot:XP_013754551.1 hypothetical protein, variant [Thecamonas trahens ATCC 50062]
MATRALSAVRQTEVSEMNLGAASKGKAAEGMPAAAASKKRRWEAVEGKSAPSSGSDMPVPSTRGSQRPRKRSKTSTAQPKSRSRAKKPVVTDQAVADLVANTIVPSVVRELKGLRINGSQVTCWVDKRRGNTGKHLLRENVFYWQVQANRRHVFSGWHSPDEVVARVRSVVADHEANGGTQTPRSGRSSAASSRAGSPFSRPSGPATRAPSKQPTPGGSPRASASGMAFPSPSSNLPPASRPFHSLTFDYDEAGVPIIEPYLMPLRFGGEPLVVYIHNEKGEHKKRKSVYFWTIVAGNTRLLHGWYSARTIVKRMRLACRQGPGSYKEGRPVKPRHLGSLYSPLVSPAVSPRSSPPPSGLATYSPHDAARLRDAASRLQGHVASQRSRLSAPTAPHPQEQPSRARQPVRRRIRTSRSRPSAADPPVDALAYANRYYWAYIADPTVVQVEEEADQSPYSSEYEYVEAEVFDPASSAVAATGELYDVLPSHERELMKSQFWAALKPSTATSVDPRSTAEYVESQVNAALAAHSVASAGFTAQLDVARGVHPLKRHTYYFRVYLRDALFFQGWYHPGQLLDLVKAAADKPATKAVAPSLSSPPTDSPADSPVIVATRAVVSSELESAPPSPSVELAPPVPASEASSDIDDASDVEVAEIQAALVNLTINGEPLVATPGAATTRADGRRQWSLSQRAPEVAGSDVLLAGWFNRDMLLAAANILADESPNSPFPPSRDLPASIQPHLPLLKRMAAALVGVVFRGSRVVPSIRFARGLYPFGRAVYHWTVATANAHITSGWLALPTLLERVIAVLDVNEPNNDPDYFIQALGLDSHPAPMDEVSASRNPVALLKAAFMQQ